MSAPTTIYVVVRGRWSTGDVAGTSMTADRIWYQHVSSSVGWLARDTTIGFSDRKAALEEAYPDGFEVVIVESDDEIPAGIAHHFAAAGATEDRQTDG